MIVSEISSKQGIFHKKLVNANKNLENIIVSGTHENIEHFMRDQAEFWRLTESHYEILPFITDVIEDLS